MGKVAVGLSLQAHSAQLSSHVALWGGLVQGGLLDTSHLSDHEEGQHALQEERKLKKIRLTFNKAHLRKKVEYASGQCKFFCFLI